MDISIISGYQQREPQTCLLELNDRHAYIVSKLTVGNSPFKFALNIL